ADTVDSYSRGIAATGTSVHIEAGSVTTTGDHAAGGSAQSNPNVYAPTAPDSRVIVDGGTGETSGYNSGRIETVPTSIDNSFVYFDGITTNGDSSAGVKAWAQAGIIVIKGGEVTTHGDNSAGVLVQNLGGANFLDIDGITTTGDHSNGLILFSNEGYNSI